MQPALAIAGLTVRAAFRFRLVSVLSVILVGGVVALPLVIKDDGTARGFTQILLTYTLTLITALLGFATLWLACGTLARDVEEAQIQMVAVKPVARWEIWVGKLLGILAVDALLLSVSGLAVFFLLQYRAQTLPAEQQQVLRNEILVSRGSARESIPDYERDVERILQDQLKRAPSQITDVEYIRSQLRERVKAAYQIVPPGTAREWKIDLGLAKAFLKDRPLYLRAKFNVAQQKPSGTYMGIWVVGGLESPGAYRPPPMSLAPDTFHEFAIPANLLGPDGSLTIDFINQNETALLFTIEDGLEVLYREGSFALNFARGMAIIFCWLALLAMLGLASASFLSFPVAAFLSMAVLVIGLSSGTMSQVIEQGTILEVNHETGVADKQAWIDHIALPVFKSLLKLINLVQGFSPIDSLSTGRSITWGQLGLAVAQICLLLGGVFSAIGMYSFQRRELATAQGNQ